MAHETAHPITTRNDFEVLSSGGAVGALSVCLTVLLLAFTFTPFAREPLSSDRLANLTSMLDDPILAEIPATGMSSIWPDMEDNAEAFWD